MPFYRNAAGEAFFFATHPGNAAQPLTVITEAEADTLRIPKRPPVADRKGNMWDRVKARRDREIDRAITDTGITDFAAYAAACQSNALALGSAIKAATTHAALDAIDINGGW